MSQLFWEVGEEDGEKAFTTGTCHFIDGLGRGVVMGKEDGKLQIMEASG